MGLGDILGGGLIMGPVGAGLGYFKDEVGGFLGMNDDRRESLIKEGFGSASRRNEALGRLEAQLQAQARGVGPSLAQAQLQRAGDQAINQQQALAASGRPGTGGLAQRMAAQNTGRIGTDLAQQAALLRLKEQQDAQGRLGQLLLQGRGQDIGLGFGGQGLETFGSRLLNTAGQGLAFAAGA